MPDQTTLVVAKPDAVRKGIVEQIEQRYREAGLAVITSVRRPLNVRQAEGLYAEHRGTHFFDGLVLAMTSGPCQLMLVAGNNAIERARTLNGKTRDAAAGTIRGDFPSAGGPFNIVHASDSEEAAKREIAIVFPDERDTVAA